MEIPFFKPNKLTEKSNQTPSIPGTHLLRAVMPKAEYQRLQRTLERQVAEVGSITTIDTQTPTTPFLEIIEGGKK